MAATANNYPEQILTGPDKAMQGWGSSLALECGFRKVGFKDTDFSSARIILQPETRSPLSPHSGYITSYARYARQEKDCTAVEWRVGNAEMAIGNHSPIWRP